ncbi:MAG: DUF3298 domain-containing protein [Flavisolibacter sp.]
MKYLLLSFFLFSCLVVSAQDKEKGWYKMLTGTIGKYPVTMHLHKTGNAYSGYYTYDSQRQPIGLTGEDSTDKGRIRLIAYSGDEAHESFSISIKDGKATGDWKKTEVSKPLVFTAVEKKGSVQFINVFTAGEKKLKPAMEESPEASIELSAVWPSGKTLADEFVKSEIRKFFSEEYQKEEIGAIFLNMKKEFFTTYMEDNKEVSDSDLVQYPMSYQYNLSEKLEIRDYFNHLLTLSGSHYSYSGGAHGMYATTYLVLDLQNKKRLTVDDLLDQKGKNELGRLLEKYFRIQYDLSPGESLEEGGIFDNKIEPNANFYFTGKGIGFVYHPYEIASYAMGEIDIFIPAKELLPYIKAGTQSYWKKPMANGQ